MDNSTFEHFDIWYDPNEDDDKPFVVAIRDRESSDERWILTSISNEDAKKIADYIYKKL